jgi:hypothetical protein
MKTGCPEPFFGGGGSEASVARPIVYMSMREALTEMRERIRSIRVRTSERKWMVRAPISQLETATSEVYETPSSLRPSLSEDVTSSLIHIDEGSMTYPNSEHVPKVWFNLRL